MILTLLLLLTIFFLVPGSVAAKTSDHSLAAETTSPSKNKLRASHNGQDSRNLPVPPSYFYGGDGQSTGFVLTNSVNGQMALLLIDKEKTPALYPLLYPRQCCIELKYHTFDDMLSHWTPAEKRRNLLKFQFFGWSKSKWEPIELELEFKNHQCVAFRVNCDLPVDKHWHLAKNIPDHRGGRAEDGTLKLPVELGICEGPRDMTICGVGIDKPPTTSQEQEALKLKRCARTYYPKLAK